MKNLGITGITLLFVLSCGGLDGNPFDAKSSNYTPPDVLEDYAEAGTLYIVYGVDTVWLRDTVKVGSGGTVVHDTIRIRDTVKVGTGGTVIHDTIRVRDTVKVTAPLSIKESTPIITYMRYDDKYEGEFVEIEVEYYLDKCTKFVIRFSSDEKNYDIYEYQARTNGTIDQAAVYEKLPHKAIWIAIDAQCTSPEVSKRSAVSYIIIPPSQEYRYDLPPGEVDF